jgi:small-conductance mechanosensitive channel
MTSEIAMKLSGFLFLFILVLYFTKLALGNGDNAEVDPDAELLKINNHPKRFRVSIVVAYIHHFCVVMLPIILFIAFSSYGLILGIVWTVFRVGEGLILINNERSYWGLLKVADQYINTNGADRNSLSHLTLRTLQTKFTRFSLAMIFWSIGTLAFSIMLVTSGVVPAVLGLLGIVAGIAVGFYNGIFLAKHTTIAALSIGGLTAILFEVVIGVRLLFF